jgi:hypothetical protein
MISKQGITALHAAYYWHSSIIFSKIPEHFDASGPSWHEFKNSFAVDTGLLHLQPFTKSHFNFLILVKFVTSQGLREWSKQ